MNHETALRAGLRAAGLLFAATGQTADLAEVYQRALLNDPRIRGAEANRLAALESKPQALATLLPQISASAGYDGRDSDGVSPFTDRDPVTGEVLTFQASTETDTDVDSWDVTLRQSLFRWENWVTLRRADKEAAQAEVDYQAAQQDLILRTS